MDASAYHSYGTTLYSAPWTPGEPDTFTVLGQPSIDSVVYGALKDVQVNGRSFSKIQVRQMHSSEFASEYIPGFEEGGQIDVTFHYSEVLMTSIYSLLPSVTRTFPDYGRKRWRVADAGGNYIAATGYIDPPNVKYEDDKPIEITMTIHVGKGRPTYTQV